MLKRIRKRKGNEDMKKGTRELQERTNRFAPIKSRHAASMRSAEHCSARSAGISHRAMLRARIESVALHALVSLSLGTQYHQIALKPTTKNKITKRTHLSFSILPVNTADSRYPRPKSKENEPIFKSGNSPVSILPARHGRTLIQPPERRSPTRQVSKSFRTAPNPRSALHKFRSCQDAPVRHPYALCPLVKAPSVRYFLPMLRKFVSISALAFCVGAKAVTADVIQLKDNASVTGKILTEKHDQVAIDVG